MATHPLEPQIPYICSPAQRNTPPCRQRHPLSSIVNTHTHTPSAHRRSLVINIASVLFPHHSSKRAPPAVAELKAYTHICVQCPRLHAPSTETCTQLPGSPQRPGARGLWTGGRDVCVRKEAFWAQWLRRPQGAPGPQRPRGSRPLLWPGQDGRNSTGWLPVLCAHPSTMRPSTGNLLAPDPAGP